ncbi:MAG: transketolase [Candidatus Kerfeldbacteria bacterium]|nr:transketolase [Candidatus Kerfeldbacteria bacterium]
MDNLGLEALSRLIRAWLIRMTTAAGSGHLSSSLSAVELMVGLMFGGVFRADLRRPGYPNNDRLIFSKGHAAPLLYALYAAAGRVSPKELLTLRKFGSRLEGHPMPRFPNAEVPTGSLGQGLSVALGEALAARMDKLICRVYCLLGDSEMAEGSVWEAIQLAGFLRVNNLVAVLDLNGLGQSGPTMLQHDARAMARRVEGFGWKTMIVDGHDLKKIVTIFQQAAKSKDSPIIIIGQTIKGQGVSLISGQPGWHGRALTQEEADQAARDVGPVNEKLRGSVMKPEARQPLAAKRKSARELKYRLGDMVAPRLALGRGLVRLAPAFPSLVVLDGEVKNSTYTELFEKRFARRFVEGYIAEQNIVGMSLGLAKRGKLPVMATFGAFYTRALDQLRMASYSRQHLMFIGTHVGVHIGQDGPSQMGLQDMALFRTLENSMILYPSDAVAAERLLEKSLRGQGMVYLRATRNPLPVIYKPTTRFTIGGSQVLRRSKDDRATVVAAGVTLHEALKAADILAKRKIRVRVIDLYSIKPIDTATLKQAARESKHLMVVEDHYPEGGIAEAVRSALGKQAGVVMSLAVRKTPRSGKPEELLKYEGINAAAIVTAVVKITR